MASRQSGPPYAFQQTASRHDGSGVIVRMHQILNLSPRWEPSWEPFAVDCCGWLWTAADSEPVGCGRYGSLRTPMEPPAAQPRCWSRRKGLRGTSPKIGEPPAKGEILSSHRNTASRPRLSCSEPVLRGLWEPSWEPFAVDCCGWLWTAADSEPVGSGRYGRLRTSVDGVRPSTDQKVGDSSSSGRASRALDGKGFVA